MTAAGVPGMLGSPRGPCERRARARPLPCPPSAHRSGLTLPRIESSSWALGLAGCPPPWAGVSSSTARSRSPRACAQEDPPPWSSLRGRRESRALAGAGRAAPVCPCPLPGARGSPSPCPPSPSCRLWDAVEAELRSGSPSPGAVQVREAPPSLPPAPAGPSRRLLPALALLFHPTRPISLAKGGQGPRAASPWGQKTRRRGAWWHQESKFESSVKVKLEAGTERTSRQSLEDSGVGGPELNDSVCGVGVNRDRPPPASTGKGLQDWKEADGSWFLPSRRPRHSHSGLI